MKTILLLLAIGLTTACSTTHIPRAAVVPVQSAPSARVVNDSVAKVTAGNDRIRQQLQSVTTAAQEARQQADAATKEAEHLSQVGSATKAQLEDLWHSLQVTQARNMFLDGELGKQSKMVNDQALLIENLRKESQANLEKAVKADDHAEEIADQRDQITGEYKKAVKESDAWKKKYEAAAPYQHIAHIVYWVAGVWAFLILAKLFAPPPYSALLCWVPIPKF